MASDIGSIIGSLGVLPPMGSRGEALVRGLRDKVPRSRRL